jgi:hypothetical protein
MELEVMNATTKFGLELMVLALFVFQPFSKCFATPEKAMSHHCCPAPAKAAECEMASCVCETTDSTSAPVPASIDNGQPLTVISTGPAEDPALLFPVITEHERFRPPVSDRFIFLHQFLI